MHVVIFGRQGCPFCTRAKQLAEQLSDKQEDFGYRYVDIHEEGITKADLSKSVGKTVETVPQVFVDKEPIGGCTEFEDMMREKFSL